MNLKWLRTKKFLRWYRILLLIGRKLWVAIKMDKVMEILIMMMKIITTEVMVKT